MLDSPQRRPGRNAPGVLLILTSALVAVVISSRAHGWSIDCRVEQTPENFHGVRYKALLVRGELSSTEWVILFGASGFSGGGEYQRHFADLMIKGSWAQSHADALYAAGGPPAAFIDDFGFEIGLSDYEDVIGVLGNDIGMWSDDPAFLPATLWPSTILVPWGNL